MLLDSCTTAGRAGERAGGREASGPIGPTWASICRRLAQPEDLMYALTHFDYNQVTPSKIAALHPFFSDPCYPKNVAARAVPGYTQQQTGYTQQQTVYGLSIWCMSVEAYVAVTKGVTGVASPPPPLAPGYARPRSSSSSVSAGKGQNPHQSSK